MQIDARFVFAYGCWSGILLMITGSPDILNHMVPHLWIDPIVAWAVFFIKCNNVILTVAAGFSSAKPGPFAGASPKQVGSAAIAFIAAAFGYVGRLVIALMIAAAASWIISPARAANLPPAGATVYPPSTAAVNWATPTVVICTGTSCPSFYVGGTLGGIAGNANVIAGGLDNSVFEGGGMIGVDAGYRYWNGSWYMGIEGMLLYESQPQASVTGFAPGGMLGIIGVKLGGNAAAFFNTGADATSQAPITIPQKLQASLMAPYLYFGDVIRKNGSAFGTGAEFVIGDGWTFDTKYIYSPPIAGEKADNIWLTGFNYNFKPTL